jgi:hypothetical protein
VIFPGYSVSFHKKTHRHDRAEILLKVALNTVIHIIINDMNLIISWINDINKSHLFL